MCGIPTDTPYLPKQLNQITKTLSIGCRYNNHSSPRKWIHSLCVVLNSLAMHILMKLKVAFGHQGI